jgi:5-methylcytosine-specific restriction protein B
LLTRGATDRVELVQFHPAYAYEDFIQGIRPTETSGALTYALEPGRFSTFCARAAAAAPALSVLIIDEINRANLPRVFGELMYLLEYREKRVELASGGSLTIPGNVHIIGTMNTADRSIARLDHALRRRFSFLRLQPKHDVLRAKCELDEDIVEALIGVLAKINEAIDDANFELGISYFLRQNIENILDDVWQGEIEPYLEEYFYDQPKVVAPFRWTALAAGPLSKWSREG